MRFSEWLKINEDAIPLKRPELTDLDIKKTEVSIDDIVELGPEVEYKGKKNIIKIGKVVGIRGHEVLVKDLFSNKILVIPLNYLYDKEELKGIRLTPSEEKELSLLGGKKLWVKLSDRQYKKFKSKYQTKMKPIIPSDDVEPSRKLTKLFSTKNREEKPKLSIFSREKPKSTKPLGRFIKKDLFGEE
jgi:hypothetical protein